MKVIDRALPSKTTPKVSSAQNGRRRGPTASGRNAFPTMTAAALPEPPGAAAAPTPPNGAARDARVTNIGPGGGHAKARPNGAGASETSAEPVSGAPSVLEDDAGGSGAELEATPPALALDVNGRLRGSIEQADAKKIALPGQVIGHVDGLSGVRLEGWAIGQPDTSDCVIKITDLASNTVVGKGRATRERADLKKLGYGRSNFAFHIVLNPTSGELGALRVTADGVELGGSPFRADAGRYHGALEVAAGSIRGWVADAFKRTRPPAVSFFDQ